MNKTDQAKYDAALKKLNATLDEVEQATKEWKKQFKPGWGFTMGGYAYYPNKSFTIWTASDGSKIRQPNMAAFVLLYGGEDYLRDFINAGFYSETESSSLVIKKRVDQQGFESGNLRGDWH